MRHVDCVNAYDIKPTKTITVHALVHEIQDNHSHFYFAFIFCKMLTITQCVKNTMPIADAVHVNK